MHKSARCPACGTSFDWTQGSARDAFSCPHCGEMLKFVWPHAARIYLLSTALSVLASVAVGLHGSELLLGTVVFYFPALCVCAFLEGLVLPVKVERFTESWLKLPLRPTI